MQITPRILLTTTAVLLGLSPALAADNVNDLPTLQIKGLLDGRIALTDDTRSWEDRGFGKTRYGGNVSGNTRTLGRVAEAAVVIQTNLTWDISGVAHLAANSQARHGVDVVEAFLAYKPAPTSQIGFRAKVGAFFPPISLENTNLGWTSPYTISSSAINTWVGEELRTIGGEGTVVYRADGWEADLTGAVFGYNDPTGSLLTWRGWAIHDREAGVFERLPLVALPSFGPRGSAPGNANAVDPFVELDDRVGFYASASLSDDEGQKLRALYYDNRANNRIFDGRQYAWHTRFGAVAAATTIGGDIDVVAQAMTGRTTMASFPTFTVANNTFSSAYVLVSRAWDQHRLSARAEVFDVNDHDGTADDPNREHGTALTLAYVFRPDSQQRLTLELLHVTSSRDARRGFALPVRANETLIQASYRLFFSWN